MNIKKLLGFSLIIFFISFKIPQAQPLPIATTYTQGIYDISLYGGKYITAKLITQDNRLTISIINSNGDQKVFLRFINPNELVKLGPIQEGDTAAIIGSGEISFSPIQ
ncbi:hypothetical protein [uncultured Clostridium sp.]|uniref:hypothetical protein n=1 Tax=uncultured Clostridium sp. TaxID=59620 RepID=UPI0028EE6F34|nr:hypothetical protein [uncultured Clostridium sp.]